MHPLLFQATVERLGGGKDVFYVRWMDGCYVVPLHVLRSDIIFSFVKVYSTCIPREYIDPYLIY